MARYRVQRRLIGPTYSTGNLKRFEPLVDGVFQRLVTKLTAEEGKPIDLAEWMHVYAVEALAQVTVRKSFGYLEADQMPGLSAGGHGMWRRMSTTGVMPLTNFLVSLNPMMNLVVGYALGIIYDRSAKKAYWKVRVSPYFMQ
jgi:hypothetical protein